MKGTARAMAARRFMGNPPGASRAPSTTLSTGGPRNCHSLHEDGWCAGMGEDGRMITFHLAGGEAIVPDDLAACAELTQRAIWVDLLRPTRPEELAVEK